MPALKPNALEQQFAHQVVRYLLPEPLRNLRFAAADFGRQWQLDFAWPDYKLGVELDGMVVTSVTRTGGSRPMRVDVGGHGSIPGRIRDMDKSNAGILSGWAILRFCQQHVENGDAIAMTLRALAVRGWNSKHAG